MSVWSFVREIFGGGPPVAGRTVPIITGGGSLAFGNPSLANETVTDSTVLGLSAAWACVNLIAGTIGSLPLMIYRTDESGDRKAAPDHSLYRILHDSPNADQTALDFWEFTSGSMELRGNSFARIERNAGFVSSLTPLWPDAVSPYRAPSGAIRYRVNGKDDVGADQMLHIRGFGGAPLGGMSTISAGRNVFGTAQAIERAAAVTFANGVRPSGVLKTDLTLTKEDRELAEQLLAEKFVGAANAGRPMLLDKNLTWQQLSFTPEDAQMLESRGWSVEEICRLFGTPPIMIGHGDKTSSWGTGVEQITLGFVKYALFRRLRRIEQRLMKDLLTPRDIAQRVTIEFTLEGLLRGDTTSRYAAYAVALQNGWMTINEVRRLENLPPVPGGDVPRMQAQNVPITMTQVATMLGHNGGPAIDDDE
jgi:HK97 family phage portal protein